MFLKSSKCSFGISKVEYLGNIVSQYRVHVEQNKTEVMNDWPQTKTLKTIKVFIGITCYYKQILRNYGNI